MRSEPAQRHYYFAASIGPAGYPTEFLADAGGLRSIALLSRMRFWSAVADAEIAIARQPRKIAFPFTPL